MSRAAIGRKTYSRRLERAGFVFVSGWVPEQHEVAQHFLQVVEAYREKTEKLAAGPVIRRGRPSKLNHHTGGETTA